jgi:predicted DNA-binding transcriptional regulator
MKVTRDRIIGVGIAAGSLIGILIYGWVLYVYPTITLQATAFTVVAAMLCVLAWIGYTLATTPPPAPIEDVEKELEKGVESASAESSREES